MRKIPILFLAILFLVFGAAAAGAAPIGLFEYAFNIDGVFSTITNDGDNTNDDPIPGGVNIAAFDELSGLGTISVMLNGAGSHYVGLFVDHEMVEGENTFFNEWGAENGSPAAGQSWEIDEPGYVFGDIYGNLMDGSLDNLNTVPSSSPEDVSMALAWDFLLGADETAIIDFILSETAPNAGFYLAHFDPSQTKVYFSSSLRIQGGGTPVPEPATILLLGTGLAGLAGLRRKHLRK